MRALLLVGLLAAALGADPAADLRLWRWLKDGGAEVDKVSLSHGEFGRSVVATRPIPEGDIMLRIPSSLVMSFETLEVHALDLQQVLLKPDVARNLKDLDLMVLFLCHEYLKGARSFFFPYISTIPQPNLDAPEQSWLYGRHVIYHERLWLDQVASPYGAQVLGPLFTELQEQRTRLGTFIAFQHPWLFRGVRTQPRAQELVRWAQGIFLSRAWGNILKTGERELIPLADMLNHHRELGNMFHADLENGKAAAVAAGTSYQAGDEVYDMYIMPSKESEFRLLAFYGFADAAYSLYTIDLHWGSQMATLQVRGDDVAAALGEVLVFGRRLVHLGRTGEEIAADVPVRSGDLISEVEACHHVYELLAGTTSPTAASEVEALLASGSGSMLPIVREMWLTRLHEEQLRGQLIDALKAYWAGLLGSGLPLVV